MPEAPLTKAEAGHLPLIDHLVESNLNEVHRQRFTSALRKFVLSDMKQNMRTAYESVEAPAFEAKHGHQPKDGREIETAMERNDASRFYSSVRYNAQEMCWASVQEPIERVLPQMIDVARRAAKETPAGGTLKLNPALVVPRYVSALDVHLIPGCFHTEYTKDDVAQGAVTALGGAVFSGGLVHRRDLKGRNGAVGDSVAHYIKAKYPDFKPRRILDMGTSSGKNVLGYADVYPDAEIHAIDVAAPLLRYGHAQAEAYGVKVHFSQQNAEHTDFADGYFDLVVSSFFFHEVPVKVTKSILVECYRLLAKGGMMFHMELPPRKNVDAFQNFYWDWDTLNNNEPAYTAFRASDPNLLCAAAGFDKDKCFEVTVPNVATFPPDKYPAFLRGEIKSPEHGSGGWYNFGARK